MPVVGELHSSWTDEQSDDDDNQRLFSAEGKEIGSSKSKLRTIVDSLKIRAKKDVLKLFLLVIFNGLYLYLGGMVFYLLEKQPKRTLDSKRHIKILLNTLQVGKVVRLRDVITELVIVYRLHFKVFLVCEKISFRRVFSNKIRNLYTITNSVMTSRNLSNFM